MNRVHFEGRLGKDPELRTTTTGKTLAKFFLVVRDARNDSQNYFFDCTAWEPIASQLAASYKKNDLIALDGRLTTNIYNNREGKSVKTYDVIAESVKMLSRATATQQTDAPVRKQGYVSIDDIERPAGTSKKSPLPPGNVQDIFKKADGEKAPAQKPVEIDWLKDLDDQDSEK